jgi:hypothetical protein
VLADQESAHQRAWKLDVVPSNDNEFERDLPTLQELLYLRRGLTQPAGKLPLFRCLTRGWAEPWFHNPLKPDWLVCKLTAAGRRLAAGT